MPENPAVTVIVCVNRRLGHGKPSCAGRGSEDIAQALEAAVDGARVQVTRLKCFGRCAEGPNVRIQGGRFFRGATLDDVPAILAAAAETGSD